MDKQYEINSESELVACLGEPMDFVRIKIAHQLDEVMKEFIACSPLAFISTIDENGLVDISPKGDPCGFVHVDDNGSLMIPERPGNKLAFGFRNILRNKEIGLIFVVPNQRETLRVKGKATLHADPDMLRQMLVNRKPALMFTHVEVEECFFHCGKALIRSKLWKPESWDNSTESIGARQFASLSGSTEEEAVRATEAQLEESYTKDLY